MKLFFTATKKGIAIALCVVTAVLLLSLWGISLKASSLDGSTYEKRMIFIKSLKISVNEDGITSKETFIPQSFGKVYGNYNELQKKAGFDLWDYRGREVTVYTYPVKGQNKNLTLIVCDGKIIGGDIADTALNGEMKPLMNLSP